MSILYHYCSTASFHAIVQSRSLWLSSLSLSNDSMEGKLVASAIARLAKKDSLEEGLARSILQGIGFFEDNIDGLGFCLSEDGDLLSQWRGYAGDATGVAIGFSAEYLNWLSKASISPDKPGLTFQKVEYEPSGHEDLVMPTYIKINQLIKDGSFKASGLRGLINTIGITEQEFQHTDEAIQEANKKLYMALTPLIPRLFRLKAYAFREEREQRLLSILIKDGEDLCSHRAVDNRIVPYRKFEFAELERSPISEVILGPKHGTPPTIVKDFLELNQYGLVKVRRSEATYR